MRSLSELPLTTPQPVSKVKLVTAELSLPVHVVSGDWCLVIAVRMSEWWYLLDEDLTQSALTKGVVLQVEAVKAVEGLLTGMHVKEVHIQIVPADS